MTYLFILLAWSTSIIARTPEPARDWLARFDLAPAEGVRLEIGGGDTPLCSDCWQIDVDVAIGVTHVGADARRLPFATGTVDLIVINNFPWNSEFLDYLREDVAHRLRRVTVDVLREITRMLAPNGRALMTFAYTDDAAGRLADPRVNFAAHLPVLESLGFTARRLPLVLLDEDFARPPTYSAWPNHLLHVGRRDDLHAYLGELADRDGRDVRLVRTYLQGYVVSPCAAALADAAARPLSLRSILSISI